MAIFKLFKKKSIAEKTILDKIKTQKKAKHEGNPMDKRLGGSKISEGYEIRYDKIGKVMELSNLQKVEGSTDPEYLKHVIQKAITESQIRGCKIVVIKTWALAINPEIRAELNFKEIKEGSEKKLLEIIQKKKLTNDILIKQSSKTWYPTYYLELK